MKPLPNEALVVRGGQNLPENFARGSGVVLGEQTGQQGWSKLMPTPTIYADFHNLDDSNRLRLTCAGTAEDLARQGIDLREGLVLTFYMDDSDDQGRPDDLLAEGVAHHLPEGEWVASIDWSAVRHVSDGRNQRANGSLSVDALPVKD